MKQKLQRIINKKSFHIAVLFSIIFLLLLILGFAVLRYYVEGESNMPFILSKISIISSAEGIDNEELIEGNKWNFTINQNNDIYLYIEKNPEYKETETIKRITINNIEMSKKNEKGELKVYKPNAENTNVIFSNTEENIINEITYTAEKNADMKNLKITNQGGIVAFRFANNRITQYIANDEEINHSDLLKKSNVTQEELQAEIRFNLLIELDSKKIFQTTISLQLPLEEVIERGTASQEFTNTEQYVFKRQKNY